MAIFLVTGTVIETQYMSDGIVKRARMALVEADNEIEAENRFEKFWEQKSRDYDVSYSVSDVTVADNINADSIRDEREGS